MTSEKARANLAELMQPTLLIIPILLNTSGAGKTRLVVKGLCKNWGFYFTCQRKSDKIGSSNLQTILGARWGHLVSQGLKAVLPAIPEGKGPKDTVEGAVNFMTTLENNKRIGFRCFAAALYARILVFACFLEVVLPQISREGFTIPKLRKMWLFMQTDMDLLRRGQGDDLFDELSGILCTIDDATTVRHDIQTLLSSCRAALTNLDPANGEIYCAIDEAQAAVDAFPVAFRDQHYHKARPALCTFIASWLCFDFSIIITGTSLKHDEILDALSSTLAKHEDINGGVTGMGSWVDSPTKVERYLARYIPRSYLGTGSGKALVSHASYWLYGR
ncbi:hypothetical protein H0H87_011943, partial [Tephrocybe sp. NHM501043]